MLAATNPRGLPEVTGKLNSSTRRVWLGVARFLAMHTDEEAGTAVSQATPARIAKILQEFRAMLLAILGSERAKADPGLS